MMNLFILAGTRTPRTFVMSVCVVKRAQLALTLPRSSLFKYATGRYIHAPSTVYCRNVVVQTTAGYFSPVGRFPVYLREMPDVRETEANATRHYALHPSFPLQVMWNCAHVMDMMHEASNYGVQTTVGTFDWPYLKEARDTYVKRLNGIYDRNLANSGVKVIQGVSIGT